MNDSILDNTKLEEQKVKKRSLVWSFFEKISQRRVQCRLCKHEQNYQGTTGNILRHLKARHDLDVTIKAQQDPQNQQRIKELINIASSERTPIHVDRKPIVIRKVSATSESMEPFDPYNDDDNDDKRINFENGNMFCENIAELQEEYINSNEKKDQDIKSEKKTKLEEDRILAETEYYREKAAYFRIQKHFTALQAKKIKLEIDQIVLNKKNET